MGLGKIVSTLLFATMAASPAYAMCDNKPHEKTKDYCVAIPVEIENEHGENEVLFPEFCHKFLLDRYAESCASFEEQPGASEAQKTFLRELDATCYSHVGVARPYTTDPTLKNLSTMLLTMPSPLPRITYSDNECIMRPTL